MSMGGGPAPYLVRRLWRKMVLANGMPRHMSTMKGAQWLIMAQSCSVPCAYNFTALRQPTMGQHQQRKHRTPSTGLQGSPQHGSSFQHSQQAPALPPQSSARISAIILQFRLLFFFVFVFVFCFVLFVFPSFTTHSTVVSYISHSIRA